MLHTGRSRNDLNATCLLIALRDPYNALVRATLRLGVTLLVRAHRYATVVMPAYTHFQAAVPITYGHYLLAVAAGLVRDLRGLLRSGTGLDRSPLGAGAVGGTTIAIDPSRTADLLGFTHPVLNSLDAVGSRDAVLRLLADSALIGVTIDRAALDLLLWSTAEFGLISMPDGGVGSSSMMPQKRNVFVLEHVQGRSAAPMGAFVAAMAATRGTPLTNSISVGTEAVAHVWPALRDLTDAVSILRMAVAGAEPAPAVMRQRADEGMTVATAAAERLARGGMPFRQAHHRVGTAVRAVLDGDADRLSDAIAPELRRLGLGGEGLDPASVSRAADYGGGPGPSSFAAAFAELSADWRDCRRLHQIQADRWRAAEARLTAAADRVRHVPPRSPASQP